MDGFPTFRGGAPSAFRLLRADRSMAEVLIDPNILV
jgi:hypothetical protein